MSPTSPYVLFARRCRTFARASPSGAVSPTPYAVSPNGFLARFSTVTDVDDERSRSSTMREPSGGKSKKRAIDDVVVMHPDVSRGIEVLHNPIYNKGTSFTGASRAELELERENTRRRRRARRARRRFDAHRD
jgi:hypothetical protein